MVLLKCGWKNYAPVAKTKFVRDVATKDFARNVVIKNEYLPPPAKKIRPEMYYEEKKLDPKPIHPVKVIEKKPALYGAPKDEWDEPLPAKPKRVTTRRKPNPESLASNPTSEATSTKVIEKDKDKVGTAVVVPAAKTEAEKEGKKAPQRQPTADPPKDAVNLDPLTSTVLNEELQQIMIKVWQELPDSPPTEAEELVADRFRNEAGDDLQNAMGLNVTARLLNVFNPLYAKLHFSGKPEAGCLQAFIRDYKISAFKRIADSLRDTFAARFDHIADFDRLCVHSEVKCGSATVTITPCFKYFSCPPSLKSIYADNMANTKKRAATDSNPQKPANTDKKEKTVDIAEGKTNSAKDEDKKVSKTGSAKDEGKKIYTEKEKSVTKVPSNTAPNKTVTAATAVAENTVTVKATKEKPKVAVTETAKDVLTKLKKVTPKKAEIKDVAKKNNIGDVKKDKQLKVDSIDDMMVVDEEMGEDAEDDEELTDQDILALMSGGIVLDECSGSDEEK